jgi:hypothetical protein
MLPMLKTLIICAVASASIMACTSTAQPRADAKTAAATARPCPQATASRIPVQPGECSATPGRTYSNEDGERTGQTNVGDALQMMDPSISVHH